MAKDPALEYKPVEAVANEPTTGDSTPVDFVGTYMAQDLTKTAAQTFADMYQVAQNNNYNYVLPTQEDLVQRNPAYSEMEPEDLENFYNGMEEMYRIYKSEEFDKHNTSFDLPPDNEFFRRKGYPAYKKGVNERAVDPRGVNTMTGRFIEQFTDQEVASSLGQVKTPDGFWIPMEGYDSGNYKLALREGQGDSEPAYYWEMKSIFDDLRSETIRSDFGDTTKDPNWASSIGRGFYDGTVPMIWRTIGETNRFALNLSQMIYNPNNGWFTGEVEDMSKLEDDQMIREYAYKFANYMSNQGQAFSRQDPKEQQGFDNSSSVLYGVSNTIGQVATMLAMSYVTGGAAGAIGFSTQVAGKIGMQTGLMYGALAAASETQIEAERLGVSDEAQTALFLPVAAVTYLSERAIPANVFASAFNRGSSTITKRAMNNIAKEVLEKEGKELAEATATTGLGRIKKRYWDGMWNSLSEYVDNNPRNVGTIFAGGLEGGLEEAIEEGVLEKVGHNTIFMIYDGVAKSQANNITGRYNGVQWAIEEDPITGKPRHVRIERDGSFTVISEQQWLSEQEEVRWADDIKNGKGLFEVKHLLEGGLTEGGMAFIGSFMVGGFRSAVIKRSQNKDAAYDELAMQLEINPQYEKEFDKELQRMKKLYADYLSPEGEVIKLGEEQVSQADAFEQGVRQEVEYRRQLIRDKGIKDPAMLKLYGGMSTTAVDMMGKIRESAIMKEQLKVLEQEKDTPDISNERLSEIENETQKISAQMAELDQEINDEYLTKEEGTDYSRAYNRTVKEAHSKIAVANDIADSSLMDKPHFQDGVNENDPEYVKNRQRRENIARWKETNNEEYSKILNTFIMLYGRSNHNFYEEAVNFSKKRVPKVREEAMVNARQQVQSIRSQTDVFNSISQTLESLDTSDYISSLESVSEALSKISEQEITADIDRGIVDNTKEKIAQLYDTIREQSFPDRFSAILEEEQIATGDMKQKGEEGEKPEARFGLSDPIHSFMSEKNFSNDDVISFMSGFSEEETNEMYKNPDKIREALKEEEFDISNEPFVKRTNEIFDKASGERKLIYEDDQQNAEVFMPSDEELKNRAFFGDLYDQVNGLEERIANEEVSDPQAELDILESIIEEVKKRNDIARVGNLVLNKMENSRNQRGHIADYDIPVIVLDEEFSMYNDRFTEISEKAIDLHSKLSQMLGDSSKKMRVVRNKDLRFRIASIDHILNYNGVNDHLGLSADLKKKMQQLFLNRDDIGAESLDNTERLLTEIESQLYNDNILTDDNIERLMKTFDNRRPYNMFSDIKGPEYIPGFDVLDHDGRADITENNKNGELYDIGYYYYINYLDRIRYTNSNEVSEKYLDLVKDINTTSDTEFVSTYEQEQAVKQIVALMVGKRSDTLNTANKVYKERLAKEIKGSTIKEAIRKRLPITRESQLNEYFYGNGTSENVGIFGNVMLNSIFTRGYPGTGKTTQVLKVAVELYKKLVNKDSVSITAVAHTNKLQNDIKESLGTIDGVVVETIHPETFYKSGYGTPDFVVWDEGSLLSKKDISDMKKRIGEDVPVIILGDEAQMQNIDEDISIVNAEQIGIRTVPLTTMFRTKVIQIGQLRDAARRVLRIQDSGKYIRFPKGYAETVENEKYGLEYMTTPRDIRNAFLNSKSSDASLVLINEEQYDRFRDEIGEDKWTELDLQNKVFVITTNIRNSNPRVDSIQGLGKNEVYMGFDPFENNIGNMSFPGRALLTTATRAINYVAIPTAAAKSLMAVNKSEVPWIDVSKTETEQDKENRKAQKEQVKNGTIDRLSSITNSQLNPIETAEQKDKSVPEKKENVNTSSVDDKYKSITKGDEVTTKIDRFPGLYSVVSKQDGEYVKLLDRESNTELPALIHVNNIERVDSETKQDKKEEWKEPETPLTNASVSNMQNNQNDMADREVIPGDVLESKSDNSITYVDNIVDDQGKPIVIVNDQKTTPAEVANEYNLIETAPQTVDGKKMFSKSSLEFDKNGSQWGTSVSVIADASLTDQDVNNARKVRPILIRFLQSNKGAMELTYIKKADVINENLERSQFFDVVAIKANVNNKMIKKLQRDLADGYYDEFGSEMVSQARKMSDNIFRGSDYVATLGDVDISYGSNFRGIKLRDLTNTFTNWRSQDGGIDYAGNEAEILEYLNKKSGFSVEGDNFSQENILFNQSKVRMRALGQRLLKGRNEVKIGDITGMSILSPVVDNFSTYPNAGMTANEYINRQRSRGLIIPDKLIQSRIDVPIKGGTKQISSVMIKGKWGASGGSAIVRFIMPKVGDKTWRSKAKEHIGKDKRRINRYTRRISDVELKGFNNTVSNTMLFQLLLSNRAQVQRLMRNGTLDELNNWMYFDQGVLRLRKTDKNGNKRKNGKEANSFVKIAELFENAFEADNNRAVANQAIMDLFLPALVDTTSNDKAVLDRFYLDENMSIKQVLTTYAGDVHMPGMYFNMNMTKESVDSANKNQQSQHQQRKILRGKPKQPINPNEVRIARERATQIIEDILGKEFIEGRLEFKPSLRSSVTGMELYGMMENGRIEIEDTEDGVEISTPRHEVFHVVYNHAIDEKSRQKLLDEAREAIKSDPRYAGIEMNDVDLEEWMAEKYGAVGDGRLGREQSPWFTPKGLLQRFTDWVKGLATRWGIHRPAMQDMMFYLDNGYFRGAKIKVGNRSVIRENQKSRYTDQDSADEMIRRKRHKGFIKLFDRIQSSHYINQIKDRIADDLYFESPFNTQIDTGRRLDEVIRIVRNRYTDPDKFALGSQDANYNGKRIEELTYADTLDTDNMSDETFDNWIQWLTSDREIFDLFTQMIFPNYDPSVLRIGSYTEDSIRTNQDRFDFRDQESDVFKWLLSTTPQNIYTINEDGTFERDIEKERERDDHLPNQEWVDYADTHASLVEIAVQARQDNPFSDNFEKDFMQAIQSTAVQVSGETARANNLLSFLERFYGYANDNDQSLRFVANNSENTGKKRMMQEFMSSITSTFGSLTKIENAEINITGPAFNKRQNLVIFDTTTNAEFKNRMMDSMRNTLFSVNGMPNEDRAQQFVLNDQKLAEQAMAYVDGTGLWIGRGPIKAKSNIINMVNGSPKLVSQDANDIKSALRMLGVRQISTGTISNLLKADNESMVSFLNNKFNAKATNLQDWFAQQLYNLFVSYTYNADTVQKINDLKEDFLAPVNQWRKELEDARLQGKPLATIQEELNKAEMNLPEYNRRVTQIIEGNKVFSYLSDQKSKQQLEGQTEIHSNNDYRYDGIDDRIHKPTDFFEVFNLLGYIEEYTRGNNYDRFFYRADGTKSQRHVLSSSVTDKMDAGTTAIQDEFNQIIENKPSDAKKSPFVTITPDAQGSPRISFNNAFLDPSDASKVQRLIHYTGINNNKTGVYKPEVTDMINMSVMAFADGITRPRSAIKNIPFYIPTTNIGDKGNLFLMETFFGDSFFNSMPKVSQDGVLQEVDLNDAYITGMIDQIFDYHYRQFELSYSNMRKTLRGTPMEGFFSNQFMNGSLLNGTDVLNEWNEAVRAIKSRNMLDAFASVIETSLDVSVNNDYTIKRDGDSVTDVLPGKALTFNMGPNNTQIDEVYNQAIYDVWKKGNRRTNKKLRDILFSKRFKQMARQFSKAGFSLPENMQMPGFEKSYYKEGKQQKYERLGVTVKAMEYQPLMKAYFYAYHITNMFASPLMFGNHSYYKADNTTDRSKRSTPFFTGGTRGNTDYSLALGNKSKFGIFHSLSEDLQVGNKTIGSTDVTDGLGFINPVWDVFRSVSWGGSFGLYSEGMSKPLTTSVDILTGKPLQIKQAGLTITEQLYKNSEQMRNMMQKMLNATSPDLYEFFQERYEETNNWKDSLYQTADFIVQNNLKDNLVWQFVDINAVKTGISGVNANAALSDESDIVLQDIDNNLIKTVLNPHQDIERHDDVAMMNQQIANAGIGPQNRQRAQNIDQALANIGNLGLDSINREIDAQPVPADIPEEDIWIVKFENFLRQKGVNALKEMGAVGNYAELISRKNISLNISSLRTKLTQMYSNILTNEVFQPRMHGLRMNQAPGHFIDIFEDEDGNVYLQEEVDNIPESERPTFKQRTGLKPYVNDGKTVQIGEAIIPFSHMKKFGVRPYETLNDMFTVFINRDGTRERINIRNKSDEEIETILEENTGLIDNDRTAFLREAEKREMTWSQYLANLRLTLSIYANRVPSSNLSSGFLYRVVGWINDTGNTIYTSPAKNVLDGSDYDIDQLTTYHFPTDNQGRIITDTETQEGNITDILVNLHEVYNDPRNSELIMTPLSLDNLRDVRDTHISDKSTETKPTHYDDFGTTVSDFAENKDGDSSIGRYANEMSAYAFLNHLPEQTLRVVSPTFAESIINQSYGKDSPGQNIAEFLNAALDNAKELILGPLGITNDASNVVGSMIIKGQTQEEIGEFFSNKLIQDIFRRSKLGYSVFQRRSDFNLFDLVDDELKKTKIKDPEKIEARISEIRTRLDEIQRQEQEEAQSVFDEEDLLIAELGREEAALLNAEMSVFQDIDMNEDEFKGENEAVTVETGLEDEKRSLKQELAVLKNFRELKVLQGHMINGEAIRRLSHFVQMRNGIKALDYEFDQFVTQSQLYMGRTFDQYIEADVDNETRLDNHIDYFIQNSNDMRIADKKRKEQLIDRERRIASAINIPVFLKAIPQYDLYMKLYSDEILKKSMMWTHYSDFVNEVKENFLNERGFASWPFKAFRSSFMNAVDDMIIAEALDRFINGTNLRINIATPTDGEFIPGKSPWLNMNLADPYQRDLFAGKFPEFVNYLKTTVEDHSAEVAKRLLVGKQRDVTDSTAAFQDYSSWYESIKDNKFLNRMDIESFRGQEYMSLSLDGAMGLTEGSHKEISDDFKRLPQDLQMMFFLYEINQNGFNYRKGGISEIIGSDLLEKISPAIDAINSELIDGSNPEMEQRMSDDFDKVAAHYEGMSQFFSERRSQEGGLPVTVVRNQIYGDSFRSQQVMRQIPGQNEYRSEYNVVKKSGNMFGRDNETDELTISTIEPIRNLSPKEYDEFVNKGRVTKKYFNGSNYKTRETIPGSLEVTDDNGNIIGAQDRSRTVRKYYKINKHYAYVSNNSTPNEVTFVMAGTDLQTMQKIRENTSLTENRWFPDNPSSFMSAKDINIVQTNDSRIELEQNRISAKAFDTIMDAIKKAIPSLGVVTLTNQDVKGTSKEGKIAWRSGTTTYYNTDMVQSDTPIHEIAHVFLDAIEKTEVELYTNLTRQANEMIKNNDQLVQAIRRVYKDITNDELVHEVIANFAGLTSVRQVNDFLKSTGVTVDNSDGVGIFKKIESSARKFITEIKRLFTDSFMVPVITKLDLGTATMGDIFGALTEDILAGRQVLGLSATESETVLTAGLDELAKENIRRMEQSGQVEKNCFGSVIARNGVVIGDYDMNGWIIMEDLTGLPKHSQGGVDVNLGGIPVNAEGGELILGNENNGSFAVIPADKKGHALSLFERQDMSGLDNIISGLPDVEDAPTAKKGTKSYAKCGVKKMMANDGLAHTFKSNNSKWIRSRKKARHGILIHEKEFGTDHANDMRDAIKEGFTFDESHQIALKKSTKQ